MKTGNNIYLVGMPGAGKTTVARQLARRLQRRFVDADHELEAATGVGIPLIFEIEGESGFRERETKVLAALAHESDLVVATGGGAILSRSDSISYSFNATRCTEKLLIWSLTGLVEAWPIWCVCLNSN